MKTKQLITGMIAALAAIAGTMLLMKRKKWDEKPPRRAPQLKIQNPGEQSDFPPPPTGERDLG